MERLSDFDLGMIVVVKAGKDWHGVGLLPVAMHSQLPRFLLFFLFSRDTVLSSGAEDAHQMYSRGSVVGEATIIDPEISPIPPLIFTGVKKCEIWPHVQRLSLIHI